MTGGRDSDPRAQPGARSTPADDLTWQARESPRATALSWDGGAWSYRELDARAAALAEHFRSLGAAPRESATLCATPGPETVAALFGLWKAGCVAVPLHERLTPPELDHARRIVMSGLHIDNSTLQNPGPGQAGQAGVVAEASQAGRPGRPSQRSQASQPDDMAGAQTPAHSGRFAGYPDITTFILTSGSAGAPRALGFTRSAFAASAAAVASRLELTAADRWGLCLSLGHIGGLSLVLRAVMTGSSVRLWPSFDAAAVADAILAGEVTHLAVVPVMLRRLLTRLAARRVPPTLRCVLVGGAAAPRALLDRAWAAGLPLATTWGMTETASQIATAPPTLARRQPGTAGRPLHGIEVRVAGDAMAGSAGGSPPPRGGTPSSPPAPLQVRGPTLASIAIARPGSPPEPLATGPDGWFTTRDLGRVDPGGLVWIEGRGDAMIVSGGLNVSPAEVERVIEGLPGVREAVVFGVPDEEWGEVVAAVVEGDVAAVSADDVERHCRERLVRGRCPSRIVVAEALPRTWTGKVLRREAAALLRPAAGTGHHGARPGPGPRAGSSKQPRETT